MVRKMTPMEQRGVATQATADKFKDKPFQWGKYDCSRLVAFHLKQFGHSVSLSKYGSYSSAIGAQRVLAKAGYKTLADVMADLGLYEIAPAFATLGDVVELEGDNPLGALTVMLNNGRVLGWNEAAEGCVVLQPTEPPLRAWKVI